MKTMYFKGQPVPEDQSKVCVLYDPANGKVVHVHGHTALDGANAISNDELKERAIAHASAMGHAVETLHALHVPVAAIRSHSSFKVNAEGTGLIEAETVPTGRAAIRAKRLNGG